MIFNINTYRDLLVSMLNHHRNMVKQYKNCLKSVNKYTSNYFYYKNEAENHLDRCTLLLTLINCLDSEKHFNFWWNIYNK